MFNMVKPQHLDEVFKQSETPFPVIHTEYLRRLNCSPDGTEIREFGDEIKAGQKVEASSCGEPKTLYINLRMLEARTREAYESYIGFELRRMGEDVGANGYLVSDGIVLETSVDHAQIFAVQYYKISGNEKLPKVPRF